MIMLTELAVTFLSMLDAAELLAELVVEEVALEEVELVVVCAELVAFATVLLARDCDVLNVAAWAACLVVDAACVAAAYIHPSRVLTCQLCNHSPLIGGTTYRFGSSSSSSAQTLGRRHTTQLLGTILVQAGIETLVHGGVALRRHFSSSMGSSIQVKGMAGSRRECPKT